MAAWDGFAVGAAIVGMIPYKTAISHKLMVQVNDACDMYVPVMGVRLFLNIRRWWALQWQQAASPSWQCSTMSSCERNGKS